MPPNPNTDYKKLLTEVIKKQMVILGPNITLAKARNVSGLIVADDGSVTDIREDPKIVIQALVDQFVQLSGLIVKKTMEPLLVINSNEDPSLPSVTPEITPLNPTNQAPIATPTQVVDTTQNMSQTNEGGQNNGIKY